MSSTIANREQAFVQSPRWDARLFQGLFPGCRAPLRAAQAWLQRREREQLLCSAVVDASLIAIPQQPLYEHRLGDPLPDFDALAYALELRWAVAPQPTRIYWPSGHFARRHGSWAGSDQLASPHKAGHDLLCSAVWLKYFAEDPVAALECWVPERRIEQIRGQTGCPGPVPDALLHTPAGPVAIEIGGHYPARWLRHHAARFERARWSWILW